MKFTFGASIVYKLIKINYKNIQFVERDGLVNEGRGFTIW